MSSANVRQVLSLNLCGNLSADENVWPQAVCTCWQIFIKHPPSCKQNSLHVPIAASHVLEFIQLKMVVNEHVRLYTDLRSV